MKHRLRFIGCLSLIFAFAGGSSAKAWRGIVPLHSTRADVRRLLGKSVLVDSVYDVSEGRVNIMYVRQRCEQGLPADWGNWNVAPDTVVNITISLTKEFPVSALKIVNLEKYKWYTDKGGATYYRLKRLGIEYQVEDGKVTGITYGPMARDAHLLCRKDAPEIRY